jgi:alcohol dehydrogenase
MEATQIFYPVSFVAGPGSINAIADLAMEEDLHKALIVTDDYLASSSVMNMVTDVLNKAGVRFAIFNAVMPNPDAVTVDKAASMYQEEKCDHLIAVGGGSPIDVAKAASLVVANGGSIHHYIGLNRSVNKGAIVIAVNTTAGTGSEVTQAFVLTDRENQTKAVSIDHHCLVRLAISDPTLMLDLPQEMTAATGMDALSHAVEAYCAVNHNPFSNGLARESVRLIGQSFLTVLDHPRDIAARTDMCWAAALAGYAFSNSGLGLIHSIGFQIENLCPIPHGQAVGMMMPYVVDFNRKVIGDRIAELGGAFGLDDRATAGAQTVCYLEDLISKANIPTLKDIGFRSADIPRLAAMAMEDPTLGTNAVQPTMEDVEQIIENAYCNVLHSC